MLPLAQTGPWNYTSRKAPGQRARHLRGDWSWEGASCFSEKAYQFPGRWGALPQNRGVTHGVISSGNWKNMLCGASLFLGGKWAINRARLGHEHKSTCYKGRSFLRMLWLWPPRAPICCLLQNYLPNSLSPRESTRRTKGPRRRREAIHQRPRTLAASRAVSAGRAGQREQRRSARCFSAALDNFPSRQD